MNQERDPLTEKVIGLAIEVHRELGPGLNESIYEAALEFELRQARLQCSRQVAIDVKYKGRTLGMGFRVDLIVERTLPIELKAVDCLSELHRAQLITYLRLLSLKRGLLLNFNAMPLHVGIRRVSL
ncbi:MAG TPA: GxxExxY protein [Gammaproteobacteria bacterium]|nr:GxxExxY protein [Gammaproteobacteria bacterium]